MFAKNKQSGAVIEVCRDHFDAVLSRQGWVEHVGKIEEVPVKKQRKPRVEVEANEDLL